MSLLENKSLTVSGEVVMKLYQYIASAIAATAVKDTSPNLSFADEDDTIELQRLRCSRKMM